MKKLLLSVLTCATSLSIFGQLEITADGKKVQELECGMKEVKLAFPIPENYKGYDKINIIVEQYAPEIGDGTISNGYYMEKSATFFDGKSSYEITLLKADGYSDLSRGWNFLYSLDAVCFDPMRTYTYLDNKLSIRGAKHNGWEYHNGEQIKTYAYETIKTYHFKHNIGPVEDFYYGASQKFTFDKMEEGNLELHISNPTTTYGIFEESTNQSEGNDAFDMSGAPPKPTAGKIAFYAETLNGNEHSMEKVIKGVEISIIQSTNTNFQINGYSIPFDYMRNNNVKHAYLPVTPNDNKSGGGSKIKFGGIQMPSSGNKSNATKSENEAKVKEIAKNSSEYFSWKETMLGNLKVKKLALEVYVNEQMTSDDAWAAYLKSGEESKTYPVNIYIGEKNGDIFCFALFKMELHGITSIEESFILNFEKTLTIK